MERCWPLHGERLLDIGCGNGAYTERLAQNFTATEAIDVSAEHLALFRARIRRDARINVRLLAAEDLDYPDSHFDVVTMIEVLEHVSSVEATLCNVVRVLKPRGALVLTVPNRFFPLETHLVTVNGRSFPGRRLPFLPWLPRIHARVADARTYSVHSLQAAVEAAGLRLVAHDYVMPPFDNSRLGRKLVRPVTDKLESSAFRVFGISIVASFVKP